MNTLSNCSGGREPALLNQNSRLSAPTDTVNLLYRRRNIVVAGVLACRIRSSRRNFRPLVSEATTALTVIITGRILNTFVPAHDFTLIIPA